MERIATIALLAATAAGLYLLKTDQLSRIQASETEAAVAADAEMAAEAAAFEALEASKIRFAVPHDADGRTRSIDLLLDGSASADADLDGLHFNWKVTDGPQTLITALDSGRASVRVEPGEYTFVLSVSDTYGSTTTAESTVVIDDEPNGAPTAEISVSLAPE
jgi:hypothetical protein